MKNGIPINWQLSRQRVSPLVVMCVTQAHKHAGLVNDAIQHHQILCNNWINLYQIKRQWELLYWPLPQNSRFLLKSLVQLHAHITDKRLHMCSSSSQRKRINSITIANVQTGFWTRRLQTSFSTEENELSHN